MTAHPYRPSADVPSVVQWPAKAAVHGWSLIGVGSVALAIAWIAKFHAAAVLVAMVSFAAALIVSALAAFGAWGKPHLRVARRRAFAALLIASLGAAAALGTALLSVASTLASSA